MVTITTAYYGADAATVAGFITQPLEAAIAQAQGIDYLSSSSTTGIVDHHRDAAAELRLEPRADRDQHPGQLGAQPAAAAGAAAGVDGAGRPDHRRHVHRVLQRHPRRPTTSPTTWSAWSSRSSIRCEGVQTAEILGARQFALRAWLDPQRWPRTA